MSTERYDIGLEVRKQVLGDGFVERAISEVVEGFRLAREVLDEDGIAVGGGA